MTQRAEIERIVREVLARVARPEAAVSLAASPTAASSVAATEKASPQTVREADILVLTERVITVAQLAGKLQQVRAVRVPPRAIVTPAARDLLRERGATLLRDGAGPSTIGGAVRPTFAVSSAAASSPSASTLPVLMLGVADTGFCPAALVQVLNRDGQPTEQLARTGLSRVVEELAGEAARGGRRALLLTERPLVAAALANRHRGVRAAEARHRGEVDLARRQLGCNLLLVDPRPLGLFPLRNMVRAFCQAGPTTIPVELQGN